jgi:N-acyl-D-aspartate/D-glutamate deacylase
MCDAGFGMHFLSHWIRELKSFSLEEGIRKITSQAADAFKIPGRGRLIEGAHADMLLFDPSTVGMSKIINVNDLPGGGSRMIRKPSGVHGVWVNGVQVHDGQDYVVHEKGPGHVLSSFDK